MRFLYSCLLQDMRNLYILHDIHIVAKYTDSFASTYAYRNIRNLIYSAKYTLLSSRARWLCLLIAAKINKMFTAY